MFFFNFTLANVTHDEKSLGNILGESKASMAQGMCVVIQLALLFFCSWVFSWLVLQPRCSPALEPFVTVAAAITKRSTEEAQLIFISSRSFPSSRN